MYPKISSIPSYKELSDPELNHLVNTVMTWIKKEMEGGCLILSLFYFFILRKYRISSLLETLL